MQTKILRFPLTRFVKFFSGSVAYATSQLVATILVAHLAGPEVLAKYLLAIAFSTPIALFFNYSLRQLVIADINNSFSIQSLRVARRVLLFSALGFACALILIFPGYFSGWECIMFLVLMAKAQDGAVELAIGLMQRDERFSIITKVLYLKSAFLLLVCGVGLAVQGVYLFLLLLIVSNSIIGFWAFRLIGTESSGKNVGSITILSAGFPLAGAAFLISLAVNLPRVGVELIIDRHSFAIFAAALQLSLPVQLLISTVSQYLMPRLVRACATNDVQAFRLNAMRLLSIAAGIGALFSLVYLTVMPTILDVFFDLQVNESSAGIMNGVAVMVFALSVLNAANFLLTATRAYMAQVKITAGAVLGMGFIIWGALAYPVHDSVWLVVMLSSVNLLQALSGLMVAIKRVSVLGE